jgi:hypothetical protein
VDSARKSRCHDELIRSNGGYRRSRHSVRRHSRAGWRRDAHPRPRSRLIGAVERSRIANRPLEGRQRHARSPSDIKNERAPSGGAAGTQQGEGRGKGMNKTRDGRGRGPFREEQLRAVVLIARQLASRSFAGLCGLLKHKSAAAGERRRGRSASGCHPRADARPPARRLTDRRVATARAPSRPVAIKRSRWQVEEDNR